MTDFTAIAPLVHQGKHNMASDAFDALRTARETGTAPKGGELSFNDLLDTLNPLQHIPVVSSIYRSLTGDTISPEARVAGGALYGGPIGLVTSVFDAAVATTTGADLGEHLVAGLTGGTTKPTAVAEATPQTTAGGEPAAQMTTPTAPAPERPKFAALDGSERTGSLTAPTATDARPAAAAAVQSASQPTSQSVPKSMPQLSPDAFNALLNSFADPKAAKAANPALAAAAAAPAAESKPKPAPADVATKPGSKDLASAIEGGLDQLDALKQAHPDIPLASAFVDQPSTSGL